MLGGKMTMVGMYAAGTTYEVSGKGFDPEATFSWGCWVVGERGASNIQQDSLCFYNLVLIREFAGFDLPKN